MQVTKPIDEIMPYERIVLDDGRSALVQDNVAFVTDAGPSATVLKHRLKAVAPDGSTVFVERPWRSPVPIVVDD